MPATTNATGSATSSDRPAPVMLCCSTYVVYAPAMMNSPCAMLMTFIWPKVSASPSAMSSSTAPMLMPVKS